MLVAGLAGCGGDPSPSGSDGQATNAAAKPDAKPHAKKVGYDLRRLRPSDDEPLATMFERVRKAAVAEGKFAAVLFSADWCEPCRRLDLEFGNMHPEPEIGHVRIFELKEEDWQTATRMNEFNALRSRWTPTLSVYPVLVILDEHGKGIEEMQEATDRLEHEGREATLPNWFSALHG